MRTTYLTSLIVLIATGCGSGAVRQALRPKDPISGLAALPAGTVEPPAPTSRTLPPRGDGPDVVSLQRACDLSDGSSCGVLGLLYHAGERVRPDHARGSALEARACSLGHTVYCAAPSRPPASAAASMAAAPVPGPSSPADPEPPLPAVPPAAPSALTGAAPSALTGAAPSAHSGGAPEEYGDSIEPTTHSGARSFWWVHLSIGAAAVSAALLGWGIASNGEADTASATHDRKAFDAIKTRQTALYGVAGGLAAASVISLLIYACSGRERAGAGSVGAGPGTVGVSGSWSF